MRKAIFTAGCILLIFSIFAKQLGIDNDEGWGLGRIAILLVALALILTGLVTIYCPDRFSAFLQSVYARKYLIAAVLVVSIIYVWTSQQNARHTSKEFQYYSELAASFKRGQLHLQEQPSQALLSLENPYDYDLRVQLGVEDFPWDVSLYKEKFYLYYGPTPALLLSVLSNELRLQVGDRHLVLAFAFGVFIYVTLIIAMFFARSNPNAPGWLVGTCVLAAGLTAPVAIMLQESRLYQVAVFGSQFFFIGGVYWIYSAITKDRLNAWQLGLAGVHWALALGTRVTIAPVILYATAATIICIFFLYKTSLREILIPIFSIGIPLSVAAATLAWYNWARFDSISEFGLTYTLTNTNYATLNDVFASRHIGTNFYNYFLHPLRLSPRFPYLIRIEFPFSNERLGGLIYIAPYIFFALLPILFGVKKILAQKNIPTPSPVRVTPEFWLLVTSIGSALIGAITILAFWTTEMRYIEDFMPSLLLFATGNIALGYGSFQHEVRWRSFFVFVIVLFASITAVASTLVGLKSNSLLFWTNLADSILRILNLK